jgi:hypothetical protein
MARVIVTVDCRFFVSVKVEDIMIKDAQADSVRGLDISTMCRPFALVLAHERMRVQAAWPAITVH